MDTSARRAGRLIFAGALILLALGHVLFGLRTSTSLISTSEVQEARSLKRSVRRGPRDRDPPRWAT